MNSDDAPGDPTDAQLASLIAAAAAVAAPEAVRAAVAAADRPDGPPQPGELWRARHPGGGPRPLVWLRSSGPAGASVVPVTFDVEQADESALVVAGERSPLGLPLALHLGAETVVDPEGLVDRLGHLDLAIEGTAGHRIVSPLDERIEYGQALADRLAALAPQTPSPAAGPDDTGSPQWWPVDTPSG